VQRCIRTAADRCRELELSDLANVLHQHALDEADHDLMHFDDAKLLVA
jgi:hypothetical protein